MKSLPIISKLKFVLFVLATCALLFYACKKGGSNSNGANLTSKICNDITGAEAVYWDLMNGIPRTDIPGGLPTIKAMGGVYSHPSFPLLSFTYPTGYTPHTDATAGAVGVNYP
ncbi:MAG TPA: hypothetical protein VL490_09195 [Mucilaginibacter sp.]|jgi:hypothetical protein|nr:hypothetical protein [Mucilaginibacter sp.]